MLKDNLGLDAKDTRILSLFARNPHISQSELGKALSISQPSVNARLQKLKDKGLLATLRGVDFKKTEMVMARVDFIASSAENILKHLQHCSFFVNGFMMSGRRNVSVFIVGHTLKKIETIIDKHLRGHEDVNDIAMDVIVSATKPFVCPIDLEREAHESCQNPKSCEECELVNLKTTNESQKPS
jgi:DNA-binding Lrp family transcriptional regulator